MTYMEEVRNHKEGNTSQDRSAAAHIQNWDTAASSFEDNLTAC